MSEDRFPVRLSLEEMFALLQPPGPWAGEVESVRYRTAWVTLRSRYEELSGDWVKSVEG